MQKLMGYASVLSARPGETVDFHVSSPRGDYGARVIGVVSVEDREEGPAWKEEHFPSEVEGRHSGKLQEIHA